MFGNRRAYSVLEQLRDVEQMLDKVKNENSSTEKAKIIGQYPQLRDLLEQYVPIHPHTSQQQQLTHRVYDPKLRLFVTSQNLTKNIEQAKAVPRTESGASSISELFDKLSRGETGGLSPRDLVYNFMAEHGVLESPEIFLRLVDRNLLGGFGARTLMTVPWANGAQDVSSTATSKNTTDAAAKSAAKAPEASSKLKKFSCALGKSTAPPFPELKSASQWFASRKLDGVRVLALLDFIVPNDAAEPLTFHSAQFVSRTGNQFVSLDKLAEQLELLEGYPLLREMLDRDLQIIQDLPGDNLVKRLVLDGEVCHMVPASSVSQPRVGDDGTGASALWEDEGLVESFNDAVSMVRRHETMERPVYFLFDTLPWVEVDSTKAQDGHGLGQTFGQRAKETKAIADWLREKAKEAGQESRVRALVQWPVKPEEIDAMVERAAEESWEGLIFRADKPYEGKRTKHILKFKKWQDAEYEVKDVEVGNMRLSVGGEFGFHDAAQSLIIEHKGHRVSVGSGLTASERIRWAADPSSIVSGSHQ